MTRKIKRNRLTKKRFKSFYCFCYFLYDKTETNFLILSELKTK